MYCSPTQLLSATAAAPLGADLACNPTTMRLLPSPPPSGVLYGSGLACNPTTMRLLPSPPPSGVLYSSGLVSRATGSPPSPHQPYCALLHPSIPCWWLPDTHGAPTMCVVMLLLRARVMLMRAGVLLIHKCLCLMLEGKN
jgi:hypothetical protein